MKPRNRDALQRLIEYAKAEAEEQTETFTAYLLELARRSMDSQGNRFNGALDLGRVQGSPEGELH